MSQANPLRRPLSIFETVCECGHIAAGHQDKMVEDVPLLYESDTHVEWPTGFPCLCVIGGVECACEGFRERDV